MSEHDGSEQTLQRLYIDLDKVIRDSVSKTGSGWARRRLQIALVLQRNLSQLTHWGTDIRNATHGTLEKIKTEDRAFAASIRRQLIVATQSVSQLRQLCERRSDDSVLDTDVEAHLIESIQTSIKGLQYQVDPLRVFLDNLQQPWAQGISAIYVRHSASGSSTGEPPLKVTDKVEWKSLSPILDSMRFQCFRPPKEDPLPWKSVPERTDNFISVIPLEKVKKFKVEPGSHNLRNITTDVIAVKTVRKVFGGNELRALGLLHRLKSPHLIQSYGAIELGEELLLAFPWAECNLREYWTYHACALSSVSQSDVENNTSKVFTAWDEIIWLSDQIRGIAQGLATMHDLNKGFIVRHGDIAPENILLIRASKELRGKLVLGDFGLSYVHTDNEPDEEQQVVKFAKQAYMSPEYLIAGKFISRPADVWSLGCVLLEFVCWVLGSQDLNNSFAKKSDVARLNKWASRTFFDITEKDGRYWAIIQPVVTECFQQLRRLPHCTEFVNDALDIVQNHMMRIESQDRVTASKLTEKMNILHAKVIASIAYATHPMPIQELPHKVAHPPVKIDPRLKVFKENEETPASTQWAGKRDTGLQRVRQSEPSYLLQRARLETSGDPTMQIVPNLSPLVKDLPLFMYGRNRNEINLSYLMVASRIGA